MRIRSVLAASVLATGILLGGAGGALATDGGFGSYDGKHGERHTGVTTFAGVIDRVGPVFYQNGETHKEWSRDSVHGYHF